MGGKKKKYNARFPPARIKKIMQTDEEIGKIAAPVPVVISRALELFLESLITKSVSIANEHSAKTLASSHIKHVISSNKNFDFLKSQVNLIPDLVSAEGEGQTNAQKLSSADKKTSCSASSSTANLTAGNPSSQIPKKRPRIVATPLATDDPTKTIKRKRGRPPKVKQEVNGQEADTTTDLSLPHKTAAAAIAADVKLESKNIVKTEATSSNSANSQCGAGVETAHPFHQSIFTTENTVLSKFNYSSPAAHSSSVLARYSQTGSGFGSSGMPLQLTTSSRHTTIESMYNNLSPTSQPVDLSTNSNGTQSNKAHLPHADTNNLYNAASSTPQAFDLSMRQHSAAASSTEAYRHLYSLTISLKSAPSRRHFALAYLSILHQQISTQWLPSQNFKEKKLGYIYHVFYDVNNDGVVDWQDFSCALEKIAALNKWGEDNPKRKHALECLELVWKGLKTYADENSDDEISKDEWFKMWSDCADKVLANKEFPYWLSSYMGFMFDAADTSGDNVIDKDEFRTAYTSFGLTAETCDSAFDKFSENGKVALTKDTYSKLWHEFFLSNDKDAKGNFLFGAIA